MNSFCATGARCRVQGSDCPVGGTLLRAVIALPPSRLDLAVAGAKTAASGSTVGTVLAAGAALLALAATLLEWRLVSARQVIRPLTAFYFVEAPGLAWAGAWSVAKGRTLLPWAMAGALFGFCVIGGSSIGPSYLPADTLLALAVLWRDRRAWRRLGGGVGIALAAAVTQAAIMLTLSRGIGR